MTAYEQGFMDKCAELGVSPGTLLKCAGGAGWFSRGIRWLKRLPHNFNRSMMRMSDPKNVARELEATTEPFMRLEDKLSKLLGVTRKVAK